MNKPLILAILVAIVVFFIYRSNSNKADAEKNIKEGEQFLTANLANEGVEQTESGLQYQVLTKGTGTEHPNAKDLVKVHYHGTLINGETFDSSVERGEPISFALNQVIPGWTEGVQLMVEGDKVRFFIPSHLGYGNRSAGKIPPGSVLIFDVELIKIN